MIKSKDMVFIHGLMEEFTMVTGMKENNTVKGSLQIQRIKAETVYGTKVVSLAGLQKMVLSQIGHFLAQTAYTLSLRHFNLGNQ